jgi:hypothetical protein
MLEPVGGRPLDAWPGLTQHLASGLHNVAAPVIVVVTLRRRPWPWDQHVSGSILARRDHVPLAILHGQQDLRASSAGRPI